MDRHSSQGAIVDRGRKSYGHRVGRGGIRCEAPRGYVAGATPDRWAYPNTLGPDPHDDCRDPDGGELAYSGNHIPDPIPDREIPHVGYSP
jgi:hypothetical protein